MTIMTLEDGGFCFFRNVGDITVDATNVEVIEANGRTYGQPKSGIVASAMNIHRGGCRVALSRL
jgi:hypothetical protein